jgi:hypothetical protein
MRAVRAGTARVIEGGLARVNQDQHTGRGVATRLVEMAVAVGLFSLGALVVFDSVRLGAQWADDGPQAGYFPFYIGSILCLCALVLFAHAFVGKFDGPKVFVEAVALRRVLRVLIPALVYVGAIQLFGIYVASAVYIGVFMHWLGKYALSWSLVLGLCLMTAFFLLFEVWFKVPLYKGLWDPLFWLGY